MKLLHNQSHKILIKNYQQLAKLISNFLQRTIKCEKAIGISKKLRAKNIQIRFRQEWYNAKIVVVKEERKQVKEPKK
ncbi:unnamed protein product [Paramecium primaurelia]|uniref:Uncharacterized protein n=1 Tax=Paramecium primaurelia TaxID=5886 RepID=A0A8S1JPN8_PARPR|nr:unnamed protein product [Paramecium primaurelia]